MLLFFAVPLNHTLPELPFHSCLILQKKIVMFDELAIVGYTITIFWYLIKPPRKNG